MSGRRFTVTKYGTKYGRRRYGRLRYGRRSRVILNHPTGGAESRSTARCRSQCRGTTMLVDMAAFATALDAWAIPSHPCRIVATRDTCPRWRNWRTSVSNVVVDSDESQPFVRLNRIGLAERPVPRGAMAFQARRSVAGPIAYSLDRPVPRRQSTSAACRLLHPRVADSPRLAVRPGRIRLDGMRLRSMPRLILAHCCASRGPRYSAVAGRLDIFAWPKSPGSRSS